MAFDGPDGPTEAKFLPNYEGKCENCGHDHTVQVWVAGFLETDLGLCGACTWGEADCLDPANW